MNKELENTLLSEGYLNLVEKGDKGICGLHRMAFTTGLFIGLDEIGYVGRFCFHTLREAKEALEQWDGKKDPPANWIKYKGDGKEYSNPNYEKEISYSN